MVYLTIRPLQSTKGLEFTLERPMHTLMEPPFEEENQAGSQIEGEANRLQSQTQLISSHHRKSQSALLSANFFFLSFSGFFFCDTFS